jgi:hypothetical protein
MINPSILIGEPLNYNGKLKIYPPRVKDVVTNPNFNIFYKVLTITQDDVKDEIGNKLGQNEKMPTPFEYILLNCQYVNGFATMLRGAFQFFCHTDVSFLYQQ